MSDKKHLVRFRLDPKNDPMRLHFGGEDFPSGSADCTLQRATVERVTVEADDGDTEADVRQFVMREKGCQADDILSVEEVDPRAEAKPPLQLASARQSSSGSLFDF